MPVTMILMIINVAAYLFIPDTSNAYMSMMLSTYYVFRGGWYTLITSMFLHGGLMHILCNMYSLYILGTSFERRVGSRMMLLIYLVSGVAGGLTVAIVASLLGEYMYVVGASGAIFGLFGGTVYLMIRDYLAAKRSGDAHVTQMFRANLMSMGSVLLVNIIISLSPGISAEAHFGGLIAGVVATAIVSKYFMKSDNRKGVVHSNEEQRDSFKIE